MASKDHFGLSKQDVLNVIRDQILYLELAPGTPILDTDIAEKLGVSRTPVREALLILKQERLVDIYPQSGTFVAPLDLDLIREIVYMRHVLECEVLLSLAKSGLDMNQEVLHSISLQELAIRENSQKDYIKNDHQFHRELFALAGHARVWELLEPQYRHTTRFHILDFMHSNVVFSSSLDEHRAILASLKDANQGQLKRLLDVHHDCELRTAKDLTAAYPHYFL